MREFSPELDGEAVVVERRAMPRHDRPHVPVFISYLDRPAERPQALLVDISAGGLGLLARQRLATGNRLRVRLADRPGHPVVVEVKNCQPQDDDFRVGCRFLGKPPAVFLACRPEDDRRGDSWCD